MADHPSSDFAAPEANKTAAPAEKVRSYFSGWRIWGQFLFTGIVAAVAIALAGFFVWFFAMPLNILGIMATLSLFGLVIYFAVRHDYRWIELEGNTLRAKHLYTGHVVERAVDDVECLQTMLLHAHTAEGALIQQILGRVKAIEIRFRDGRTPLRVQRVDPAMTHAAELIEAVYQRLSQQSELAVELATVGGKPIVSKIYRQGETPKPKRSKSAKIFAVCLLLLGGLSLLFGMIFGIIGTLEKERREVAAIPPHEITAQQLIAHGPGQNRHVIVTQCQPGGFTYEAQGRQWKQAWIALFPVGDTSNEIQLIYSTSDASSPMHLEMMLHGGRAKGICSKERRSSWGSVLGPELVAANPASRLDSAWAISDVGKLATDEELARDWMIAVSCLAATCGCAVVAAAVLRWRR